MNPKYDNQMDELDQSLEEGKDILSELYSLGEAFSCLEGVLEALERFKLNCINLHEAFDILKHHDKCEPFVLGTLLCGLLSAFEAFVHDLFELLLKNDMYWNVFLKRNIELSDAGVGEVTDNNRNKMKSLFKVLNKTKVREDVIKRFRGETVNNPFLVAEFAKVIFKFNVHDLRESVSEKLLKIRNSYTHNGGAEIKIAFSDYDEFCNEIDRFVAYFSTCFNGDLDSVCRRYSDIVRDDVL